MANEYLPKLDFMPIVAPYAGNASKEFSDLGTSLRNDYDKNRQAAMLLQMGLSDFGRVAADDPVVQEKLAKVQSSLNELSTGVTKGLRYELAAPMVDRLAVEFAGDRDLKAVGERFRNDSAIKEFMAKNPNTHARWSDMSKPTIEVDEQGNKKYNLYPVQDVVENLFDQHKEQSQLFNDMKASGSSSTIYKYTLEELARGVDKNGKEIKADIITQARQGISTDRIIEHAKNVAYPTFKGTEAYKQRVRQLRGEDLEHPELALKNPTAENIENAIIKELTNTGLEYAYQNTEYKEDASNLLNAVNVAKVKGGDDEQKADIYPQDVTLSDTSAKVQAADDLEKLENVAKENPIGRAYLNNIISNIATDETASPEARKQAQYYQSGQKAYQKLSSLAPNVGNLFTSVNSENVKLFSDGVVSAINSLSNSKNLSKDQKIKLLQTSLLASSENTFDQTSLNSLVSEILELDNDNNLQKVKTLIQDYKTYSAGAVGQRTGDSALEKEIQNRKKTTPLETLSFFKADKMDKDGQSRISVEIKADAPNSYEFIQGNYDPEDKEPMMIIGVGKGSIKGKGVPLLFRQGNKELVGYHKADHETQLDRVGRFFGKNVRDYATRSNRLKDIPYVGKGETVQVGDFAPEYKGISLRGAKNPSTGRIGVQRTDEKGKWITWDNLDFSIGNKNITFRELIDINPNAAAAQFSRFTGRQVKSKEELINFLNNNRGNPVIFQNEEDALLNY